MTKKKIIKISILIFLVIVISIIAFSVYKLSADLPSDIIIRNKTSIKILRSLEHALKYEEAAERMQEIFPEGACFSVTLYGLSWSNIIKNNPDQEELRSKGIKEIKWVLDQYDKAYIAKYFKDTEVEKGVFWLGQKNIMLGKFIEIVASDSLYTKYIEEFHWNSKNLHGAFLNNGTNHLNSQPGICWPADNVTALSSLVMHDKLFNTKYKIAYDNWKIWTNNNLDIMTGLPVAQLNNKTGELLQKSRGCANSWIITLISEFDKEYSQDLFTKYKEHFLISRFGIKMFREDPKGVDLPSDVDSGPIFWGTGAAATGIGLGAALLNNDFATANDIYKFINLFCFPSDVEVNGEKAIEYFYGELPIADAFIAWQLSMDNNEKISK